MRNELINNRDFYLIKTYNMYWYHLAHNISESLMFYTAPSIIIGKWKIKNKL